MSDMVDRLREQSKFHNSSWVMELFAEAADYVESLEQQLDTTTVPKADSDAYDDAMSIL